MSSSTRVPLIDPSRPSVARMHDYLLGGGDNFAVDRELADELIATQPEVRASVRANRAFLGRSVRYLVSRGVTQFLDIGSGIPTLGNVHEVARRAEATTRVVYVDIDPVAVAHGRQLLADTAGVAMITGDFRRPAAILAHQAVVDLFDFDRPIAVLLIALLQFVNDAEHPDLLIRRLTERLCPGSALVIADGVDDGRAVVSGLGRATGQRSSPVSSPRGRARIEALFAGFDLVEPGLVAVHGWRLDVTSSGAVGGPTAPDDGGGYFGGGYAAVGIKRGDPPALAPASAVPPVRRDYAPRSSWPVR